MLPRVHKARIPGRPILSANKSPTEGISALIDSYIRPHVNQIKSYIKDTKHFIKVVENLDIPENAYLVSFDIVSLYTNIPHINTLKSVAKVLRQDTTIPTDLKPFLLKGLKMILEKNTFEFNGRYFLISYHTLPKRLVSGSDI